MSPAISQAERIARLNDRLRAMISVTSPCLASPRIGMVLYTKGLMSLPPDKVALIWSRVRDYQSFTPEYDPYGERDLGVIDIAGVPRVFWKIDYYSDGTCSRASEDPSDPARSFRVLTVMLAAEH